MGRTWIMRSVICLAAILTVAAAPATWAGERTESRVQDYALSGNTAVDGDRGQQDSSNSGNGTGAPLSLGAMTADGNSPGYIIGRTYRDDQGHLSPGRMVDWGIGPQIHFIFTGQPMVGDPSTNAVIAAWHEYKMFEPTVGPNGVFLPSVFLQSNPLAVAGWYPNMDVDETGHMISAGEIIQRPFAAPLRDVSTYWDVAGPGMYGIFIEDPLPQSLSLDPNENLEYPKIEYQEHAGNYITHVVVQEPPGFNSNTNSLTYWRRMGGNPTFGGWTSRLLTDQVYSNQFDIAVSKTGSGEVAVCWILWPHWLLVGGQTECGAIAVIRSHDAGITFGSVEEVTPFAVSQDGWYPWVDLCALFDTDDYLHIVYNAEEYDGSTMTKKALDPSRIFHWTDRVPGPYGGGSISLVHLAEGLEHMCGPGRPWVANTAKPVISQCNDKLYVTWQQYGDLEVGDTLDCPDPLLPHTMAYMYNADLYVSASLSLDGQLWDAGRNMTNSKSLNCDGSNANNCDHDAYGTMARYGMNTASYYPTYWDAAPGVFEVRDVLDPTQSDDGWYLDFMYINDLMTEPAGHPDAPSNALWTYNPIKWFRLPCVDPIIAPKIYLLTREVEYPHYWAGAQQQSVVDVAVENIGNITLDVSNVVIQMTVGSPSWLNVAPTSFSISPGDTAYFQLTINPGGAVSPATNWESVIADLIIYSNDPGKPEDTVVVNTIIGSLAPGQGLYIFGGLQTASPKWQVPTPAGDFTFYGGIRATTRAGGVFGPVDSDFGMKVQGIGGMVSVGTPLSVRSEITGPTHYCISGGGMEGVALPLSGPQPIVTAVGAKTNMVAYVSPGGGSVLTHFAAVRAFDPIVLGDEGIGPIEDPRTFDVELSHGAETFMVGGSQTIKFMALVHSGAYPDPDDLLDVVGPGDTLYHVVVQQDAGGAVTTEATFGSSEMYSFEITEEDLEDAILAAITVDGDSAYFKEDMTYLTATVTVPNDGTDNVTVGFVFDANPQESSGCCGIYTEGITGNANCSDDGKLTLSDITRMIDRVYISKDPLCCEASGNTNASEDCKITLSDITVLIDAVYISKTPPAPCMSNCE